MIKIVGQITSKDEALEIESITKSFVIGNLARNLAQRIPLPCNKLHGFPPTVGEQNAFGVLKHIIPCDSSHKLKFGDFSLGF